MQVKGKSNMFFDAIASLALCIREASKQNWASQSVSNWHHFLPEIHKAKTSVLEVLAPKSLPPSNSSVIVWQKKY